MKKTKKILLFVTAFIGLIGFVSTTKAAELTSNFVENLCVVKEDNKLAIKFDLLKDVDLSGDISNAFISIMVYDLGEDGSHHMFGGACIDGVCESSELKIVDKSTTCSVNEVDGTDSFGHMLTKGMTLANYYNIINNKEEFVNAKNLEVEIDILDNNYDYENIVYNLNEKKIKSISSGHDRISEVNYEVINRYSATENENFMYSALSEDEKDYILGYARRLFDDFYMTKAITVSNYEEKSMEEILKSIDDQINSKDNFTSGFDDENKIMNKNALNALKENGYRLSMNRYDEDDNIVYSWTFDGSKISNVDIDVDMSLVVGNEEKEKAMNSLLPTSKESPLSLTFNHHGNLPEGTTVSVKVKDRYADGEKLTLYYYNGEKLEEVAKELEVINGYVTFGLEHCSDYVLAKENGAPNNSQTSSIDVSFYVTIASVSILGMIALVISKKKIA